MTREQYENHFYRVPGAWYGSFITRGTARIVVDESKAGEAIRYLAGFGFTMKAEPSKREPDGIALVVR